MEVPTRDEEAQIAVAQHSSNTNQTRTSTGDNAHVLPCILALPPLAMVLVVQRRDSLSQWPNSSRGAVLSAMSTDVDMAGSLEAALYAIIDLGRTLSQICPFFGLVEETVLVGLLGGPDNTCGGTGCV